MKIVRLDIEGFKSLRKVSWEPGDLNIVIGPNGSGKSNLLQFLELIAMSAQGGLGKYIQSLGGMEPIVWDGSSTSIKFSLDRSVEHDEDQMEHYEVELAKFWGTGLYTIKEETLNLHDKNSSYVPLHRIENKVSVIAIPQGQQSMQPCEFELTHEQERESFVSFVTPPAAFYYHKSIFDIRFFLSSIAVHPNLRTDKDAPIRQPTISRFEKQVESDGQNLISVLYTLYTSDRDFEQNINAAMHVAFGDDFEKLVFPPASDGRFQLRIRWKSLKNAQPHSSLSDGTLRFLFLLTVLANPDPPPVIAIDEPETGLHPSMLPVIAEFAQDAATRSQVIFTTHSPQFLDAFTDAQPTTTVAQWENGETILRVLPKDELAYWLENYSLGALFCSGELENMG